MDSVNVTTLQQAYSDVARGDVEAVAELLDQSVSWKVMGEPSSFAPFGEYTGQDGARDYLAKLGETLNITSIKPYQFVVEGDTVVVLGKTDGVMRATGKAVEVDWAHVFTFRDGKVIDYKEFVDTARILNAAH